jgi:TRAP-type C4-dicarboxylate transport system permease small subunit
MRVRRLETLVGILATTNRAVAAVLFALLTAVVSLQVFTRFVVHAPVIWSEEAARFLFFWVVLLGAAVSVKDRRHFVIDVTGGSPSGGGMFRFLFDIVPDVCVLSFSLLLLAEGIGYTQVGLFRTGANSQVNMAFVYAAIPAFAALSLVYSAANLLVDWTAFRQGRAPTPRPPQAAD